MPIPLDRRTRSDADTRLFSSAEFFKDEFPKLAVRHGGLVARAAIALQARPLTLRIEGETWSILPGKSDVALFADATDNALVVELSQQQFSDLAQNLVSFNGLLTARELQCKEENRLQLSIWDSLWLTLLDGWPTVDVDIQFLDRKSAPLNLQQIFTPADDPADIAHFLREVGFLHLRGWLDPADMNTISADMDRAMPSYKEGDGKSWWATLSDGSRYCVRQQEFVEHSPTTARILSSEIWEKLRATIAVNDPVAKQVVAGRVIEALIKPIGVIAGPSDLSFHRDCHLGRHQYECSHFSVGISLTSSSKENGLLQVIAGSHRVAMPVEIAKTQPYLQVIDLETQPGDLTVHLSCTLHASTPPQITERRVMYTPFVLEGTHKPHGKELGELRERVPDLLRQEYVETRGAKKLSV